VPQRALNVEQDRNLAGLLLEQRRRFRDELADVLIHPSDATPLRSGHRTE
jgi:hypothetical protein